MSNRDEITKLALEADALKNQVNLINLKKRKLELFDELERCEKNIAELEARLSGVEE